MIKKLSLLMLLMALFAPWAANAQETLTVYGNETSTNSQVPLYGLDADYYQKCEFVIPSSELQNMTGGTISQMAFYTASTTPADPWSGPFQVFLKEVESTSISAFSGTSGATTVYTGTLDATSGTMNVVFNGSTPTYTYNGGNLLVGVYLTSTTGNWKSANFYGKTVSDACVSGYNNDALESCTPTQRNFVPRITFTYTPSGNYCLKPTMNPAEYIEEDQASLSWTENGTATSWVLQYSTSSDFSNATSVNRSGIPAIVIHDLAPSSYYHVRVKAHCGDGDESNWSNVISFHTACGAITTFPVTYGFETSEGFPSNASTPTTNQLGACWRNEATVQNGTYSTRVWGTSTSYKHNGSQALVLPDKGNSTNFAKTMLVFPPMEFTNTEGYTMSFWIYRNGSNSNPEGFKLYVSDTDTISTNAVELGHYSRNYGQPYPVVESASSWYQYETEPIMTTGTVYLIFEGQSYYGSATYVDDITIKEYVAVTANQIVNTVSDPATEMTWSDFVSHWNNGDHFTSTTFTLMDDITITEMAGTGDNPFTGTFDGNGHTITVSYGTTSSPISEQKCAPFSIVNNAVFQNLAITGSIYTSQTQAGGLVGYVGGGCTITNCISNVAITSTYDSDDATFGGFIAQIDRNSQPTITFNGCAFTGSLSGSKAFGGFVGWNEGSVSWSQNVYSTVICNNCVFAPSSINVTTIDDCAVFARSYGNNTNNVSFNNCYYTYSLGTAQGKQAYSVTGVSPVTVAMSGTPTTYSVSGINAYTTGIVYNGTIYAGEGETLTLTLSGAPGYEASHGTFEASGANYTLLMDAYDTQISGVNCPVPFNVAVTNVEARSAQITWEGNSDTYKLMYRNVITAAVEFDETYDFEDGTMQGWTSYDQDGDNVGWAAYRGTSNNGSYCVRATYNSSIAPLNWLISPEIPLGGTISFYAKNSSSRTEQFQVYVSTTGTNISDFTPISELETPMSSYTPYEYNLSSYSGNGYVAIKHTAAADQYWLYVDDITITNSTEGEYGAWQTVNPAASPQDLSSLMPETTYQVKVSGICDGVETDESQVVEFTTPVSCPVPTNLIVSDIDAHGAKVTWDKVATQETGNITYNYTWVEQGGTPDWTLHGGMSAFDRYYNTDAPCAFAFGLEPETTYDFYVRRDCGEDDYSAEVIVTFTTAIACPAPTEVTISDITGHEATATWTGSSENYVVEVGSYDYTATPTNGIIQEEDFESGSMPTGWTHIGSGSVNMYSSTSSHIHDGTYCLQFSGATANNVLVLPQFAATPNSLQISFWSKAEGSSSGSFDVGYVTDASDASSFVAIQSYSYSQHNTYQYVEDISMTTAPANARIAFRHRSGSTAWYWFIDDITIKGPMYPLVWTEYTTDSPTYSFEGLSSETSYFVSVQSDCGEEGMSVMSDTITFTTEISCPAPTGLAVIENSIYGHGATMIWDRIATEATGPVAFNYVCVANGDTLNWDNASIVIDNVDNTNPPTVNLTGLDPETAYDFYLRRDCGEEDYSVEVMTSFTTLVACPVPTEVTVSDITGHEANVTWSGSSDSYIVSYRTAADVDPMHTEGFEDNGSNIPTGWTHIGNGSLTMSTTTSRVHTGIYSLRFSGATSDNVVVLPELESEANTMAVYFWSLAENSSNSGTFQVGYVTNATDASTFHEVGSYDASAHLSYTQVSVSLASAPAGARVAFRHNSASNSYYWWIDDIAIGAPIAAGEWQTIIAEESSVTLTSLIPETLYEVKVQGDCGEDGLSQESTPVRFTTDVTCPTPTGLAVVENSITGHGATVTWNGYSDSYNVMYRAAAYFDGIEEGFDSGNLPSGWENKTGLLTNIMNGEDFSTTTQWAFGNNNGVFDYHARINIYGSSTTERKGWLISPEFTLPANATFSFDLALTAYSGSVVSPATTGSDDRFVVLISTDNEATWTILREWNNGGSEYVYNNITCSATGEHVDDIDISRYVGQSVRIAFYGESTVSNADNNLHIDNVFIGHPVAAGEWQTVTAEETSVNLTGLIPETLYEVVVQKNCGDEGTSIESEPITFTTDIACPVPADLTATDVTSNSAVLNWTSDAESYNVSYYKAFCFYGFEEGDDSGLDGWTILKNGDEGSIAWHVENPNAESSELHAHNGDYVVSAESGVMTYGDNWLISPQIEFPNQATLKFWVMRSTYDDSKDEFEVLLSINDTDTASFNIVLKEKTVANPTWTEVVIDLGAYSGQQGYIAIRHEFYDGFFIKVDDFGVYGWSEPIATTDNSLFIENLLPETEYQWKVQANCGDEDGMSHWASSSFITSNVCPTPTNVTVNPDNLTAASAELSWTGSPEVESYTIKYRTAETTEGGIVENFEGGSMPDGWTQEGPGTWIVNAGYGYNSIAAHGGTYNLRIGHSDRENETFLITPKMDLSEQSDATMSFWYINYNWGTSDIDQLYVYYRINEGEWNELWNTTENHQVWTASGDISLPNPSADYQIGFKMIDKYGHGVGLDDINIAAIPIPAGPWQTANAAETNILLTGLTADTEYEAIVRSDCSDDVWSDTITFKTLDESTKIFVTEGDWSDGNNWVPAGVPTIDEDVILRAEATVFDVAEANTITIQGTATLTIEDGGQLKTNADVTATMKKFIIGYGTDYVETNNGYYLMTLPTAVPIAAADAGLITEESDYDLYSWDKTATDEEWQNNHDGIDLQNGVGFLYANSYEMEMSFTATIRNSSEPVVVTPSYDEVEHGGWNLYGNPFPCEAYITTDAEGMTFYRLVDNELVPIEGAIAPLEAFFVKATAAGQTFTISREAPAK